MKKRIAVIIVSAVLSLVFVFSACGKKVVTSSAQSAAPEPGEVHGPTDQSKKDNSGKSNSGSKTGEGRTGVHMIELDPDDDKYCVITVSADPGSTLLLKLSNGESPEVSVPESGIVSMRVPVVDLLPSDRLKSDYCEILPSVYLIGANGSYTEITGFTPITVRIPVIGVEFDCPDQIEAVDGYGTVSGRVDDPAAAVVINGVPVEVGSDGSFSYTVHYDEPGLYTVSFSAELNGCRSFVREFLVNFEKTAIAIEFPWEYGDMEFSQRVKNSDETITVRGRVTPGTSVTASCASVNATLSVPSVAADGTYSFTVNMRVAGDYVIVITCEGEDGETVSREMHVQRTPNYSTYIGGAKVPTYSQLSYENAQAYKLSGTVTAILSDGDFVLAELTLADGNKVILEYHHHYASANKPEVGMVCSGNVYGRPIGPNEDGVPVVYVWFID